MLLKSKFIAAEDEERVEWLRNWMFENIPMARPFTPLASIANKNDTVNLRCQVVNFVFEKSNFFSLFQLIS